MTENNGRSFRQACLSLFTNGHFIIAAFSLLTVIGSAAGVYSALRSDITRVEVEDEAVRRDIVELRDQARQAAQALENWQRDEKAYDSEIRGRLDAIDQRLGARLDGLDSKFAGRIDSVDGRLTAFLNSISERLSNLASLVAQQQHEPQQHDYRRYGP